MHVKFVANKGYSDRTKIRTMTDMIPVLKISAGFLAVWALALAILALSARDVYLPGYLI